MRKKVEMLKDKIQNPLSDYIPNYISIVLVHVLRMLVPFLIIVLIGRFYSAGDFGRYAVATAFMGVIGFILNLGISNVVSFEVAALKQKDRELRNEIAEILESSIIILLIFFIFSLFLSVLTLPFLNYSEEIIKIIFALFFGYFFMAINSVLSGVFIGLKEMKKIIPAHVVILISTLIIVVPFIYLKRHLYVIASLWSISQFIGIWVFIYLLQKKNLLLFRKIKKEKIPYLLKRSTGVGLENVIFKLGTNLTNILLPFYLTEANIGIFNGAFKPFVLLVAGNQIAILFFNPYIASRRNEAVREKERILDLYARVNIFFTCTIIAMPFFFSSVLNKFIFGNKLLEGIPYMPLLALGFFIIYLPPYTFPLKALGKEWKATFPSVGQLIINLLAIVFLVPRYGIKGAVYAVLLAYIGYWIINIFLYLTEKLKPISNIANYIFFILYSLLNGLIVQSIFKQTIYSVLIFIFINAIGAFLIFLTNKEKRLVFSYLNFKIGHDDKKKLNS